MVNVQKILLIAWIWTASRTHIWSGEAEVRKRRYWNFIRRLVDLTYMYSLYPSHRSLEPPVRNRGKVRDRTFNRNVEKDGLEPLFFLLRIPEILTRIPPPQFFKTTNTNQNI